jgi:hypothetical protein
MKEQIEEIAKVLCEKYDTEHCKVCDHNGRCMVRLEAELVYEAGYRKQSEWISVEDRMPDRPGEYLVYTWNGHILMCNCCDYLLDGDLQFDNYNVTHWIPLPEAPKMKGE